MESSGVAPRYPLAFFKCSSQRSNSVNFPSSSSATTARVTTVPGYIILGRLGHHIRRKKLPLPFLARSPTSSTCASLPRIVSPPLEYLQESPVPLASLPRPHRVSVWAFPSRSLQRPHQKKSATARPGKARPSPIPPWSHLLRANFKCLVKVAASRHVRRDRISFNPWLNSNCSSGRHYRSVVKRCKTLQTNESLSALTACVRIASSRASNSPRPPTTTRCAPPAARFAPPPPT